MSRILLPTALATSLLAGTALADVPNVAVDIAPVHSLVARVMQGVGEPALIIQPGASPHEYRLRPSEAAALQEADLVFWIGADLTPWMENAVDTLATNAAVTSLLEAEGTTLLDFRENALFEAHSHDGHEDEHGHEDHDHDGHDEEKHGHDDHDHDGHGEEKHAEGEERAHGEEHAHDDHDHDHEKHAEGDHHAHGDHDPHVWLSPQNANAWLNIIAAQLSSADPENAGAYFANAAAARAEMETLSSEVAATLEPVKGGSFIVFHDAYQYFENDFGFPAAGAISLGDASDPSPARIAEIQGRIRAESIDCVLAEPQFNANLIATVLEGTEANTAVIDPLGAALEPGQDLYPELIRNMAKSLAECL